MNITVTKAGTASPMYRQLIEEICRIIKQPTYVFVNANILEI
jgi:hypothetical protein